MKKIQEFDGSKLQVDMDKLLKKHKITNALFITENYNTDGKPQIFVLAECPDKKIEPELGHAVGKLFVRTGLRLNAINSLNQLITEIDKHNKVTTVKTLPTKKDKDLLEKQAEAKLSITDKKLLEQYRKLKREYIVKQNYEMACEYRDMERKLLQLK